MIGHLAHLSAAYGPGRRTGYGIAWQLGRRGWGFDWSFTLPLLSAYVCLYNLMTRMMVQIASTMAMTNAQHLGFIAFGWLNPGVHHFYTAL